MHTNPRYSRAAEKPTEVTGGNPGQKWPVKGKQARVGAEFGNGLRRLARIVRTNAGADIAAVDLPPFVGTKTGIAAFNRQIGPAQPGIEAASGQQSPSRASPQTAAASAASVGKGRVGAQKTGSDNLSEKNAAAYPRHDELTVAADKTDAGTHGPIALENRRRIDRHARERAEAAGKPRDNRGEPLLQDTVVILAEGIIGNERMTVAARRPIRKSHRNHRHGSRKQPSRIKAQTDIAGHILHASVASFAEPAHEAGRIGGRDGPGPGYARGTGAGLSAKFLQLSLRTWV